jgi:hypothetical protein
MILFVLTLLTFVPFNIDNQVKGFDIAKDTVTISYGDLKTNRLRNQVSEYLVVIKRGEALLQSQLWTRAVSIGMHKSKPIIKIEQYWQQIDSKKNKRILSLNHFDSFSPIYHKVQGHNMLDSYDYKDKVIVGSDSVLNNDKIDFSMDLPKSSFNFELDLEILSTLPFKKDRVFMVNFYHPGSKTPPKYYAFEVVGIDKKRNAWILETNYDSSNKAKFWIDKDTYDVLLVKDTFGPITRFKYNVTNSDL